ncbi:holo-ACP synthase [Suttonella sp. R2A3]|uniref:holo-ACP synthase n=1 Tax=Suttonella sp. R2A3 TaxID=2908648 RepID=UPI001F162BF8|nr:holo-ACP synthase [Suttonella sp. R2A3]UJF24406.1 holo-ACP synthase [Suttonella sp. R2A3]
MIGTDIIDKRRIAHSLEVHGERFANKVLHPKEWDGWLTSKDPTRYLAMRWAAKEALSKALGTGLRSPVLMPAICITHNELGAPGFAVSEAIEALIQARGYSKMHLSLSDERHYIVAFVLCEK